MSRILSQILTEVRQDLEDEFSAASGITWPEDQLATHVKEAVREVSRYSPQLVKDTSLTTTAASRDITVSGITGLLNGAYSIRRAEYPVDRNPPKTRTVEVLDLATIRLVVNTRPTAAETVYLYCDTVHTLTEAASTLTLVLEDVVKQGAVQKAVFAKARTLIDQANVGGHSVAAQYRTWAREALVLYREALQDLIVLEPVMTYHRD